MINNGQIEREEALKQEKAMVRDFMEDKDICEILEHKIGLSRKEVANYLSFPKIA